MSADGGSPKSREEDDFYDEEEVEEESLVQFFRNPNEIEGEGFRLLQTMDKQDSNEYSDGDYEEMQGINLID